MVQQKGLFKRVTNTLFREINKIQTESSQEPFTFKDIRFSDGWTDFDNGKNGIVAFRVEQTPGWLYGLWWKEPQFGMTGLLTTIEGQLFAQYEDTIDKFKPSHSHICVDVIMYVDNDRNRIECYPYDETKTIRFIQQEPELAFCRDYRGWDYNMGFHSREEAWAEFAEYKRFRAMKERMRKEFDTMVLNKVAEIFAEDIADGSVYIFDRGENWSPRYEIVADKSKIKGASRFKSGCYGFEGFFDQTQFEELEGIIQNCEDMSDVYNFFWYPPVHMCFDLLPPQRIKRFSKVLNLWAGQKIPAE